MSVASQGGQPCSVPFPVGIFPFWLSCPEKYGFTTTETTNNNLPTNDLVPRKQFKTSNLLECMQNDEDCGLLLEPCADLLRQCNLDHVVVVCDVKVRNGETYILLHTLQSIEWHKIINNRFLYTKLEKYFKWKQCKNINWNKSVLQDQYFEAPSTQDIIPWSEAQEQKLLSLKDKDIKMKETTIAVSIKQMMRAVCNNIDLLSTSKKTRLKDRLNQEEDRLNQEEDVYIYIYTYTYI